jgi:hypothetical protein
MKPRLTKLREISNQFFLKKKISSHVKPSRGVSVFLESPVELLAIDPNKKT